MAENLTSEDIMQIIDNASERVMADTPEIDLSEDAEILGGYKKEKVAKIIEGATEKYVKKEQKGQAEEVTEEIKKRFARLKKVSKENFNMFEVAMLCHKLAKDYKTLARLNGWKEIEAMFD